MIKTIKIMEKGKIFYGKISRVIKKDGWIYDYDWKIAFKSEKYREEFLNKIKIAQKDIKEGRLYSLKELEEILQEEGSKN